MRLVSLFSENWCLNILGRTGGSFNHDSSRSGFFMETTAHSCAFLNRTHAHTRHTYSGHVMQLCVCFLVLAKRKMMICCVPHPSFPPTLCCCVALSSSSLRLHALEAKKRKKEETRKWKKSKVEKTFPGKKSTFPSKGIESSFTCFFQFPKNNFSFLLPI